MFRSATREDEPLAGTGRESVVIAVGGRVETGSIQVLEMLGRLGYATVDADALALQCTRKGSRGYQLILDRVGAAYLDSRAELDQPALRQAARRDPGLMQAIRSVVYPLVNQLLVEQVRASHGGPIFIRAGNPDAYGLRQLSDRTWMITACEEAQIAYLVKERGWARVPARQFVRSQPPMEPMPPKVDLVMDNSRGRSALWEQVAAALRGLRENKAVQAVPEAARHALGGSDAAVTRPVKVPAAGEAGSPTTSLRALLLRRLGLEMARAMMILLVLAIITSWGLILAESGRLHLPVQPWQALARALVSVGHYLIAHPRTYYWASEQVAWFELVATTLGHSAGLLLLSMSVALVVGLPLGIAAATTRRKSLAAAVMAVSVFGASTPSFLLAMMLWVVNIWVHRSFNVHVLPATGFGWDAHLILPVVVLAVRPLTQLAQITYVTTRDILQQDYVRTAHSKGLSWRAVRGGHVLPNARIPILNTLGASLRFSLTSLPVVEVFFHWPGVGSMLLDAINLGMAPLVIDLIIALGLFFLSVNLLIEFSFPLIDPRLRRESEIESRVDVRTWRESLTEAWAVVSSSAMGLIRGIVSAVGRGQVPIARLAAASRMRYPAKASHRKWLLQSLLRNPILLVSSIAMLLLAGLTLFGGHLTSASPYQVHGVMAVNGVYGAPPFKPSSTFPWGTDQIGRDIQALVWVGAQKTLTLAFFGMMARLLLGSVLGLLAGWNREGRFDHVVTGAIGIWAAYPATLFAMIVIQGLGIQQGMWVFVVAICLVGWGEVAQFVRGQVISLKPLPFIESARSAGARADQILIRHVLPNLANPIIVLASLEMGSVLLLLAELGYLNIFMGGGFRAMIGESGTMQPVIAYYSDVPEWGALIANVREHWRSYPWMALYPGLAVFASILTFNLFGEGLRRFLDESQLSLSRLFNRSTFALSVSLAIIMALILQSSVPLNIYRSEGLRFDPLRVMEDIRILSSPQLGGRETGAPGATLAALYIARRMGEIGIFPAGEHHGYFQRSIQPRLHLQDVPTLTILDETGALLRAFTYKQDFKEIAQYSRSHGSASAPVVGVAYGSTSGVSSTVLPDLRDTSATERVVLIRSADLAKVRSNEVAGILVVADETNRIEERDVYPSEPARGEDPRPYLLVSPDAADALLRTAGSSLAALDAARSALAEGSLVVTAEGARVSLSVPAEYSEDSLNEGYLNVIGVIPGQGHFMGTEDQIIVVSAYYDGIGTDPSGEVYPAANDNASGVATMLELARLLKQSTYQPDKTVLFVAWAGGERQEGLSVVNILNARPGASDMTVETVLELSGVGYGSAQSISIGSDSSYRLIQLFQQAAGRYGVPTTTRGRGPHADRPVRSMLGGRNAMTLSLAWDGSDDLAHSPLDTASRIDPVKLRDVGRPAFLTLLVLCRETAY